MVTKWKNHILLFSTKKPINKGEEEKDHSAQK